MRKLVGAVYLVLCLALSVQAQAGLNIFGTPTAFRGSNTSSIRILSATIYGVPVSYDGTDYIGVDPGVTCDSGCNVASTVVTDFGNGVTEALCASDPSYNVYVQFTNNMWTVEEDIYVTAIDIDGTKYTIYVSQAELDILDGYGMLGDAPVSVAFEWNATTKSYDTVALTGGMSYITDASTVAEGCTGVTLDAPSLTVTWEFVPVWEITEAGNAVFNEISVTTFSPDNLTVGNNSLGTGILTVGNYIQIGQGVGPGAEYFNPEQYGVFVNRWVSDTSEASFVQNYQESSTELENYVKIGGLFQIIASPTVGWDGEGDYQGIYGLASAVISIGDQRLPSIIGTVTSAHVAGESQTVDAVTGHQVNASVQNSNSSTNFRGMQLTLQGTGTVDTGVGLYIDDVFAGGTVTTGLYGIKIDPFTNSSDVPIWGIYSSPPIKTDGLLEIGYLDSAPSTLANGTMWMESDGLHIYYNGTEQTVAIVTP